LHRSPSTECAALIPPYGFEVQAFKEDD
jgi:hypothetical protein